MSKILAFTSIFIICFTLLPAQLHAMANTYYVTQSGNGAKSGESLGNAWTVSDFNALSGTEYAGDTFYFSGAFTTRIVITGIEGTSGNPVILDGFQAGNCDPINSVCLSSALLQDGMSIGNATAGPDYINIQDFRMTRQSSSSPCFQISAYQNGNDDQKHIDYLNIKRNYIYETNGTMFSYYGGRYTTVQDNKFTHYGQNGTDAVQGVNLVEVDDFVLKENEIGHDEGSFPSGCTSAELIELHGCQRILIEYNDLYGAPNQSGIRPKEWGGATMHDIFIRYNNIHENGDYGIHTYGPDLIYNVYIYANNIYDNSNTGIGLGGNINDIHIWSNLISSNGRLGVSTWSPGLYNIYIYNNTFTRNGDNDESDAARGGIASVTGSSIYAENNIFWNNRPGGAGSKYHQIYDATNLVLEHNTYYHSLSAPNFYYSGWYRSLSTMQSTYSREDDSPAGVIAAPGFIDPDGRDNIYGTADDDYRLDGTHINNGTAFSNCFDVSIQGNNYRMCYDDALDPSAINWTTIPPIVNTIKQGDYGSWDRGAYVYKEDIEPMSVPPPPFDVQIIN